ncbi:hypothetical protein ABT294_32970 [Nonomuraea sp. NPDC000554]|uniref:hypothetical protein n=1 Tax=Nonomuraea sp. NPDC000554 TaxID=3154259 RepID=UPI003332C693
MDVCISRRVREQRDVDLILGQGLLKNGWDAHRLDAPASSSSPPEHDTPRRARTYLLNDDGVQATAKQRAGHRSPLDQISVQALGQAAEVQATSSIKLIRYEAV